MERNDYSRIILNYLFFQGASTRAVIAEQLDIRKNTVGTACAALLKEGKIVALEPSVKRNSKLKINPRYFLSVGIEHMIDCLKISILDAELNIVSSQTIEMANVFEEERVYEISKHISAAISAVQKGDSNIVGIGFSDFIPHDIGTGLKTKSIWMPGWGHVNIKDILEHELHCPTSIMRCTDAHSIAEKKFGACRDEDVFICVQLGDGIGLSIFHKNTYLKGSTDIFGELGHAVCKDEGEICKCGNRGCLETVAGTGAIIKKVQENIEKGIYFKKSKDNITLDDIIENAHEGNKLALLVLNEAYKCIGDILAVVINVLGITKVVLYGDLIKAEDLLFERLLESIKKHCIYPLNHDTEIVLSALDDFASATGAAYEILRKYFSIGEIYGGG
jgi:predicted NBD/HSP70 family sugar kinase